MTDRKFIYSVTANDEKLLVKGLLKRRLGFSSRLLRKMKNLGGVYKNDLPAKMNASLAIGDIVSISFPEEKSEFVPQDISITVAYEDEDLLLINKQPGIVVHPTKGHPTGTIANGLMRYMETSSQSFKIRFVNRLDMDTSGLVIVAKNSFCQDELSRQMSADTVVKKYVAVVKGIIEMESGTIDLPIGKATEGDVMRMVHSEGMASITHYKVLERFKKGYTLVEIKLDTGRTHQIRVHMAHIGHPIVGDNLYGSEEIMLIERHALHAKSLSFRHPVKGHTVSVNTDIPDDMINLLYKIADKQ